ncbi:MAG: PIN domain-containing protein [Propionibacteriaceae bacterium]|jgi:predicted nucleic acid-binding protein|nr:PIN domain-containing protein [Propionibacteriaceae bacterium]
MRVVVYDADVLYSSVLRDVLIRVGIAGLARPRWTERILDEVFENLAANRPDLDETRLARTRRLMNAALRDVTVTGHERWIKQVTLPDPNDRHVLAAAIEADAEFVVTKNLKHFPASVLAAFGMTAVHPDHFLLDLCDAHRKTLRGIIVDIAAAWKSTEATPESVLDALAKDAPSTAALLRDAGNETAWS